MGFNKVAVDKCILYSNTRQYIIAMKQISCVSTTQNRIIAKLERKQVPLFQQKRADGYCWT